jgi:signal peptidase I
MEVGLGGGPERNGDWVYPREVSRLAPAPPTRGTSLTGDPAPIHAPSGAPDAQAQPRTRSRYVDAAIEIVTTVGLAVILYLVITTFFVQTFRVEQHSMQNTLQPGEHLLIDKITPRFDSYSRGDIIVFHPNGDTSEIPYIKRVIAVGGEHVSIHDGQVWINGVAIDESAYTYTDPQTGQNQPTVARYGQSEWDVPEGMLFVLGDHRQASTDSRSPSVGFVNVDDVIGRAWLEFFPLDTLGIIQTPTYPELQAAS